MEIDLSEVTELKPLAEQEPPFEFAGKLESGDERIKYVILIPITNLNSTLLTVL